MSGIKLYEHQKKALARMFDGCILNGDVGSGKSRTAIAYYFTQEGGEFWDEYIPMNDPPRDLYIITTARKRDTMDWEFELAPFLIFKDGDSKIYNHKITIDSWNNIQKYTKIKDAFFIFDEQRVVGWGPWSKSFVQITKNNGWILLSATPGDSWKDYIPVFIANGFYKNKTEFEREHIIWNPHTTWPSIDRYVGIDRLVRLRDKILIDMEFDRNTVRHNIDIKVPFDEKDYKFLIRERFITYKDRPLRSASELCYELRKIVNSDPSRIQEVIRIVKEKKRVIVFYNFDYELDILLNANYGEDIPIAQWNGHRHEGVPDTEKWVYLVQYTAGAEGWNCIKTDTIVFYSQNYSYKILKQAEGRIDRLNTTYVDLYYYHIRSRSSIDIGIKRALDNKKNFNEMRFLK